MSQTLPSDVVEHICLFLINDGTSLARFSLCSQDLYRQIVKDHADLWNKAIDYQWSTSALKEADATSKNDPRQYYIQRYSLDHRAKQILEQLTIDLQRSLRVPEDAMRIDGNHHVGQAWDHVLWKELLLLRGDVVDYLQHQARVTITGTGGVGRDSFSFQERLRSFLAARALQTIQFAECLYDWKRIQELYDADAEANNGRIRSDLNIQLLEQYALLVDEMQLTPDQLIHRPCPSIKASIIHRLDGLAKTCKVQICDREAVLGRSLSVLEKIHVINDYLFGKEEFRGNNEDYYNYRNSLLDYVLESKKGIPITLAILYSCICRRLDISVHLVGLPGHAVLGFVAERGNHPSEDGSIPQVYYLDVFHQGTLLTVQDCQRICDSYFVPWDEQHLQPLPARHVLQRMLNNLANCHFHGLATGNEPFHSDLFFHQRALASIQRQPSGIAGPLVDRVTQELPLTLSPDLLRLYGLLTPSSNAPEAPTSE